jgi:hypothetical protein
MIAIVASLLLGAYVFLPDFLFKKFAFNYREVVKAPTGRFGDVFSGAWVAILPYVFTFLVSRYFWFFGHWP